MEKFTTRTSIFHLTQQGIIYKKVIEGINLQPKDVDEDQEMLVKLAGRKKVLVLVNAIAFHTMTPEAIDRLSMYASKSRYATAMVSQSLGVRIFVNTISSQLKKVPFEMFETEMQATKWLLTIKRDLEKKTKKNIHNTAISPRVHKKPIFKVRFDSHGILTKKVSEGAHIDLKAAMNLEQQVRIMAGNKKILTLVDHRASHTVTLAALKFIQKNIDANYRIATALIAPKQRSVQPIRESNSKTQPLVKIFKDKPSAIKWLLSMNPKKRTRS